MKKILTAFTLVLNITPAFAKDCKETVLTAAIQAELMLSNSATQKLISPIDAQPTKDPKVWKAFIIGHDGKPRAYSVEINPANCEVLSEPLLDTCDSTL